MEVVQDATNSEIILKLKSVGWILNPYYTFFEIEVLYEKKKKKRFR